MIDTVAQWDFLKTRPVLPDCKTQLIRASHIGEATGDGSVAEIEFWSLDWIRTAFPKGRTQLPMVYEA